MSIMLSYTKTHKLITALYMVTDIVDKDEPLRNKLRTLGVEILSDIISLSMLNLNKKIQEVLSFLDLASAINIISEMNCNILKKEFSKLNQSILDNNGTSTNLNGSINISEFFTKEIQEKKSSEKKHGSIGHRISTRIGVQKGSTLLKALSNVEETKVLNKIEMSDNDHDVESNVSGLALRVNNFDLLRKQRRNDIIMVIKDSEGSATITDIKNKIKTNSIISFASCGEKTLQRELISMVKDDVLYKTGEKRWSKYFIK